MDFIISAKTDVGIAKPTNQDSFYVSKLSTPIGRMAFCVMCDGMGGLIMGDAASSFVTRTFEEWSKTELCALCENGLKEKELFTQWRGLIRRANEKLIAFGYPKNAALGTTAAVILVTQKRWYCANVGDTRVYEITGKARILTKDHTFVAQEIESGRMTKEEAQTDRRRNALTMCVGASEEAEAYCTSGKVRRNAVYMLCSDGFRHRISDTEIAEMLMKRSITDETAADERLAGLTELIKYRGERDNITSALIIPEV